MELYSNLKGTFKKGKSNGYANVGVFMNFVRLYCPTSVKIFITGGKKNRRDIQD